MNPDILTAPSSTLMSRHTTVDWFKGAVKMSEFFLGAAAPTYQVLIVGGHTNGHSPYNALSVAILGRANRLGLCDAGKVISMGGIIGTLMLLETSGCGAVLNLDTIPCPPNVSLERWLLCFPSYGFLLSVRSEKVAAVQAHFRQRDLVCEVIGEVQPTHQLLLQFQNESTIFWDLSQQALTGFSTVRSKR